MACPVPADDPQRAYSWHVQRQLSACPFASPFVQSGGAHVRHGLRDVGMPLLGGDSLDQVVDEGGGLRRELDSA
jgi:hypothetical protein